MNAHRQVIVLAAAALAATVPLAACAGGSTGSAGPASPSQRSSTVTGSSYPPGALVLRDTIPTQDGGRRFIASNISGSTGNLDVVGTDGRMVSLKATEGATLDVDGVSFTVLDVVPNTNTSGAPGSSTGRIVLVPR